jgi:isoleucyl-tRNA synthetase
MAPFLSFTAEEAWKLVGTSESIYLETYACQGPVDTDLIAKWSHIRTLRDAVNKDIEVLRAAGQVGSSLQAKVTLNASPADHAVIASLGDDAKFVFITSALELVANNDASIAVMTSSDTKCERCWHYCADVGTDVAHPTICARCVSNLVGVGETRTMA